QRVNCGDKMDVGIGFEDITSRAGAEHFARNFLGLMHRENQDFSPGDSRNNLPGRIEAVQLWHADVDDRKIRLELSCLVDRLPSVRRFGTHLPTGPSFQQRPKPAPDNGMIICNHDSSFRQAAPSRGRSTTLMVVPRVCDWISRCPPSSCTLSRMPAIPTPTVPAEFLPGRVAAS